MSRIRIDYLGWFLAGVAACAMVWIFSTTSLESGKDSTDAVVVSGSETSSEEQAYYGVEPFTRPADYLQDNEYNPAGKTLSRESTEELNRMISNLKRKFRSLNYQEYEICMDVVDGERPERTPALSVIMKAKGDLVAEGEARIKKFIASQ